MKELLRQIKWVMLISVIGLVALFVVQNAAVIELRFFNWEIAARRAFLVLTCLSLGFVLGWAFGATAKRS